MVDSRLAVGCPLLSTLVKSSGRDVIALKGSGAAAGLFEVLFPPGFPRVEVALLFVPLAGEARIVELDAAVVRGTCTMLTVDEGKRLLGGGEEGGICIRSPQVLFYRHRRSEWALGTGSPPGGYVGRHSPSYGL